MGFSLEGADPLPSRWGHLVVEGGYRKFFNATAKDPAIPDPLPATGPNTFHGTDLDSNCQSWLASALWRRSLDPEGLYIEAGLHGTAYISRATWIRRTVTVDVAGAVHETQTSRAGSSEHQGLGPTVGVGFRFDGSTSLGLRFSQQTHPLAGGGTKSLAVLELSLGTHF